MSIRILLADDHKIIREGLRSLIEKQSDMEVVAEAGNGRAAVQLAQQLRPDVLIMDITMPDLNGIDATKQIIHYAPGVKVIALSVHSDSRFVTRILEAGASGYLLKDCAFEELATAIRAVTADQDYVCSSVTPELSFTFVLTPREREVLQLLAEGRSTKQIASSLHLSLKTVETHRRNIMEKLKVNSVAELTKYAIREGLTSLEF